MEFTTLVLLATLTIVWLTVAVAYFFFIVGAVTLLGLLAPGEMKRRHYAYAAAICLAWPLVLPVYLLTGK